MTAVHGNTGPHPGTNYERSLLDSEPAPGDALSQLLVMLETSGQNTIKDGELRINDTQEDIREQLEDLLQRMAAAFREAKKQDDGGFFGNLFDKLTNIIGDILGTIVELNVEVLTSQLDLAVSLAKSMRDGQNLLATVGANALALTQSGQISADVKGASIGVTRFAADAAVFLAKVHMAAAEAALTGENPKDLLVDEAEKLAASLDANIIENPHFWAVSSAVLRGAAIASAVGSGGAMAPVAALAVCLVAVLEADTRYNLLEETVGKDAAPGVRLALGVAASICLAMAPTGTDAASQLAEKFVDAGRVVQAVATAYAGVRQLSEANRQGDALDLLADQKESLNRLHNLQRLLTQLLGDLEDDAENQTRTRGASAKIVATVAATEASMIIPA